MHCFKSRFCLFAHCGAPSECGGVDGIVDERFKLAVHSQNGNRRTCHIDGSHEVSDDGLVDGYAVLIESFCDRVVEDVELLKGSSAETVDKKHDFFALLEFEILFEIGEDAS